MQLRILVLNILAFIEKIICEKCNIKIFQVKQIYMKDIYGTYFAKK